MCALGSAWPGPSCFCCLLASCRGTACCPLLAPALPPWTRSLPGPSQCVRGPRPCVQCPGPRDSPYLSPWSGVSTYPRAAIPPAPGFLHPGCTHPNPHCSQAAGLASPALWLPPDAHQPLRPPHPCPSLGLQLQPNSTPGQRLPGAPWGCGQACTPLYFSPFRGSWEAVNVGQTPALPGLSVRTRKTALAGGAQLGHLRLRGGESSAPVLSPQSWGQEGTCLRGSHRGGELLHEA